MLIELNMRGELLIWLAAQKTVPMGHSTISLLGVLSERLPTGPWLLSA